jgi:CubicO group peptidase (beta-lactamase class C family)
LLLLSTLGFASSAPAQQVPPRPTSLAPATPTVSVDAVALAKVDAMLRSYVDADQFMGDVLIAKDGKVVFDKSYGLADREARRPNTPGTRFYVHSMTKQFTAASILLLEERGKLTVDDPVGKYLPDLPEAWRAIPLRNLLTHTSGIPNYSDVPEDDPEAIAQRRIENGLPSPPAQKLTYVRDKPLEFPTDTNYRYSNTNYLLLGMVVEKLSGQPYARFLQRNFFTPLHMNATAYNAPTLGTKGYTYRTLGIETPLPLDRTSDLGASGISSTTHDMLKWQSALFGGKVLSPASLTKMTTAYKFNHGTVGNYGFGQIMRGPRGALRYIYHSGGGPGFNATMAWYPDVKLSVIILSNVEPFSTAPGAEVLRSHVVSLLSGEAAPAPVFHRQVNVSPEVLARYPGTYALSPEFSIVITLEDGQLFQQGTGQGKHPIYPESETQFFLAVVDVQFDFLRGPDGKVTSFVLREKGQNHTAVRQ